MPYITQSKTSSQQEAELSSQDEPISGWMNDGVSADMLAMWKAGEMKIWKELQKNGTQMEKDMIKDMNIPKD